MKRGSRGMEHKREQEAGAREQDGVFKVCKWREVLEAAGLLWLLPSSLCSLQ